MQETVQNPTEFIEGLKLVPDSMVHKGRKAIIPRVALTQDAAVAGSEVDNVPTNDPTKNSASVVGGAIQSFVAGVSPQNQADILNSCLLAQLASNLTYDREKDTVNWYHNYKNILENVGWVLQGFNFSEYTMQGSTATMDKVVLDVLAAVATGDEVAIAKEAINALKSLSDSDNRIVLFEHESHSQSNGNFQIGIASENGGAVAMKIGAFYFSSTQNVTKVLWFSFSSSSAFVYKGAQSMTLNDAVYSNVRQPIITKLGDNAKKFVASLPDLSGL